MCKLCKGEGVYRGITGQHNYCCCTSGNVAAIDAMEKATLSGENFKSLGRAEQIAYLIRFNAERWAIQNGYKRSLKHLCGLCSAALAQALKREGFKPTVVEGEAFNWHHAWVIHGRKIIDVTFTQFDGCAPKVLISAKGDKRFRPLKSFNGRRLDEWLIGPRLFRHQKDIETLIAFQPTSAGSRDISESDIAGH